MAFGVWGETWAKKYTFSAQTAVVNGQGGSAKVMLETKNNALTSSWNNKGSKETTGKTLTDKLSDIAGGDLVGTGCGKVTFTATRDAGSGYEFLGWYHDEDGTSRESESNPYTEECTSGKDTSWVLYAGFTHRFYFAVEVGIDPAGTGTGLVSASFSGFAEPTSTISKAEKNSKGTVCNQSSMDCIVYLKATAGTNDDGASMIWQGWYLEDGTLLSTEEKYAYSYSSMCYTQGGEVKKIYARFKNPVKVNPSIIVGDVMDGGEVNLKVDDKPKLVLKVDENHLSVVTNTISRVDDDNADVISYDATTHTLVACRAGKATITFHHEETEDFKEGTFTFTVNVEKHESDFSWKNPTLLDGTTLNWSDFVSTSSQGAWSLVSGNTQCIPTMTSAGLTSAVVHKGKVTLTFRQGTDYKYKALPAQTKEFQVFTTDGQAVFQVGSQMFTDLNAANDAAYNGTDKTIVVVSDGMLLAGDYTISDDVTLLVPYNSSNTIHTTQPGWVSQTYTPSVAYRTLTLVEGANIIVEGTVCVGGQALSSSAPLTSTGGSPGRPVGPCGVINMSKGGHIEVKGKLYVWGYIRGQGILDGNNTRGVGTIDVVSGGEVREDFIIGDYHGGRGTYTMNEKHQYNVFPFNNYFVQNIEVPMTIQYGASEYCATSFNLSYVGDTPTDFILIGASGTPLFKMNGNGATVKKWYDATTDHFCIELTGNSNLNYLTLQMGTGIFGATVDSRNFFLPIPSGMRIIFSDCDVSLDNKLCVLPGGQLEVSNDASVSLNSSLYIYDQDQWDKFALSQYFYTFDSHLTPHKQRNGSVMDDADAMLKVNGRFSIGSNGKLYTTISGADICSDDGGHIVYPGSLPGVATAYQVKGNAYGDKNEKISINTTIGEKVFLTPIEMNNALMHNENNSYTQSIANTTFDNLHGRWFSHAAATTLNADHTYNFTYYDGTDDVTVKAIYSADKTGLVAGYKWVNVTEDSEHTCGTVTTFKGDDNNLYIYKDDAWLQLILVGDGAVYSGSDDQLYSFLACDWVATGEIDGNCMYTIDGVKVALVGDRFIEIVKDEYDEVYNNKADANLHYMLFDGCVWQEATKVEGVSKAYTVRDDDYVWCNRQWTQMERDGNYYYTTDEAGVKHYYEYDETQFSWVPAKMRVRITSGTDEEEYRNWDDAMSYLSQYDNPTVTLLDNTDASLQITNWGPSAKSTICTIDLNGHTVTANLGNAEYFMNMNTTATITITDKSSGQGGAVNVYANRTAAFDGIRLTQGTLVMEAGTLFVKNTATDGGKQCRAISTQAGKQTIVTMNGGTITAEGSSSVFGILQASSGANNRSNNTIVTINGGTLNAIAASNVYGIRTYGRVSVHGGTINAKTTAVNGLAASNTAYGIDCQVSVSAVDANSCRSTLYMDGGIINAISAVSAAYGVSASGSFTTADGWYYNNQKTEWMSDDSYKATDGTWSNKASAHIEITGGCINAVSMKGEKAYGIRLDKAGANSYTDKSEDVFPANVIRNVTISSKATNNVYGILLEAGIHSYTGGKLYAKAEVEGVNVNVEATLSNNAYGMYVSSVSQWSNRGTYLGLKADKKTWYVQADDNDGDVTHEGIDAYYEEIDKEGNVKKYGDNIHIYRIGERAVGAQATIKSGTFYAKAATTSAYGVYVNRSITPGPLQVEGFAQVTIDGGTFTGETTADTGFGISSGGNTTINGGTFSAICGTTISYGAYCWSGTLDLKGGTYSATSTGTTAYGVSATGLVDKNLGTHSHGTVNIYDGVVVNARSLNASTTAGIYATGVCAELNKEYYDARSDDNKKLYFLAGEDGKLITPATERNVYAYRCGLHTEGGVVNVYGGTFNVTSYTTTAAGVRTERANITRESETGRFATARGTINVYDGTFNVETETNIIATGVYSYGIVNVEGGVFNIKAKTTNGEGVRVYDGITTIKGGIFNVIAGTNTAYGVSTLTGWDTNWGFGYYGEVVVNNGTFDIKTYNGDNAYAANIAGATTNMKATKVSTDVAKDYAIAGKVTINGGTFTMTPSTGKGAIAFVPQATQTRNDAVAYPKCDVTGGFFKMNGTTSVQACGTSATLDADGNPNLNIKGGHFSTKVGMINTAPKIYVVAPYSILDCVEEAYKADYPFEVAEAYTITFVTDDGQELWKGLQAKGTTAVYPLTNGTPEKAATSANSFEFTGWDHELAEVTGEATYTANFTAVAKKYMVTWTDDIGKEYDHKEYASGETPMHDDPVKEGYTFTGWTPAITAVTDQDQTYKATFTIKRYTIQWLDEDGSLIKEETKDYGSILTAPKPTKEGYSFSAWNPAVTKVTGDAVYKATYLLNIASVTPTDGTEQFFTTWDAALGKANSLTNGSTLKLLVDLSAQGSKTISKTMTIDLNGHTFAGATSKLFNINGAGAHVTITDTKGGGRIESVLRSWGVVYGIYVTNGTLTLEGGTIHCENILETANDSYRAEAVYVAAGKTFNMTGGTIEASSLNMPIGIDAVGTINISGGTIEATGRTKAWGINIANAGTNTIANAVVGATAERTENAVAVRVNKANAKVNISGGDFSATATTSKAYAVQAVTASTIAIQGTMMEAVAPADAYGIQCDVAEVALTADNIKVKAGTATVNTTATAENLHINSGFFDKDVNLATYIGSKKAILMTDETLYPELAKGYLYKLADEAYKVTFESEDGSTILQESYIEKGKQPVFIAETPVKPANPRESYVFYGWKNGSVTYTPDQLAVVSADVVYTAVFTAIPTLYPITFTNIDGMGGSYVQQCGYGLVPVYNGPTPVMVGSVGGSAYIFDAWEPALAAVTEVTTYTATFRLKVAHTVTFDTNGKGTNPSSQQVAEGAAVARPDDQIIDDEHIVGWYRDQACTDEWDFDADKMPDTDLILYAKWGIRTFTIVWKNWDGTELARNTVDYGVKPSYSGDTPTKPSQAEVSYEFSGWSPTVENATADATYVAQFVEVVGTKYRVLFHVQGHGTAPESQELKRGEKVVKPADLVDVYYDFGGWYKDAACSDGQEWNFETDLMPARNLTLYAKWTEKAETGDVLDIVDWTESTLTINATGFAFSGWPYTVNGEEFGRENVASAARKCNADRTVTIPYTGKSGERVTIAVTKSDGTQYSYHSYVIPYVYADGGTLTGVNEQSTVVVRGGSLTVGEDTKLDKIYVSPEAEVVVPKGKTLTANTVILRTTPWQAASLQVDGTINATETYYTRIVSDNTQYFQFAIPLSSAISKVRLSNNKANPYGKTWILKGYSESSRAANGASAEGNNWKLLSEEDLIQGTLGYELYSNSALYREFYFPVDISSANKTAVDVSYTANGAAGSAHAGWNAICSPLLGKYKPNFTDISKAIKISELTEDGNYWQHIPEIIRPAVPFYYQAPNKGTLDFADKEFAQLAQNVPRRAWHTSVSTQWLRLTLNDATGKMLDETDIFTHPEKFSVDYESGYDVAKQSTTGTHAVLYSELACGALAFAALPDSVAESRIPISVYTAEAKAYTFRLEDNAYLNRLNNVFLHDMETGAVIDLLASDYEVMLREGTTRGRFYITCVFRAQNVTTDIETTVQDKQTATIQKVFYNGKVYILRNGIVYDLTGRQCEMK